MPSKKREMAFNKLVKCTNRYVEAAKAYREWGNKRGWKELEEGEPLREACYKAMDAMNVAHKRYMEGGRG